MAKKLVLGTVTIRGEEVEVAKVLLDFLGKAPLGGALMLNDLRARCRVMDKLETPWIESEGPPQFIILEDSEAETLKNVVGMTTYGMADRGLLAVADRVLNMEDARVH